MFQLWKLVLLCGLLTGTSASLLGNLGTGLKDVIDKTQEIIDNTVETVAGNLIEDINRLQNSKLGQLSEHVLQKAEDLLMGAVSKVLSISKDIVGLKVSNVQILNVKTELTSDGEGLKLGLPISADVELSLPLIGKTVDAKLSVDLLGGVRIETQGGSSKVVMTECASDPASISLSLLDKRSELANRLTDAASSFLSQTLSTLVEVKVCPLLRLFVSTLGVDFVQGAIDGLQNQIPQQLLI